MPSDHYDPQFSRSELFDIRMIPLLERAPLEIESSGH
jgi:hypothetical protein